MLGIVHSWRARLLTLSNWNFVHMPNTNERSNDTDSSHTLSQRNKTEQSASGNNDSILSQSHAIANKWITVNQHRSKAIFEGWKYMRDVPRLVWSPPQKKNRKREKFVAKKYEKKLSRNQFGFYRYFSLVKRCRDNEKSTAFPKSWNHFFISDVNMRRSHVKYIYIYIDFHRQTKRDNDEKFFTKFYRKSTKSFVVIGFFISSSAQERSFARDEIQAITILHSKWFCTIFVVVLWVLCVRCPLCGVHSLAKDHRSKFESSATTFYSRHCRRCDSKLKGEKEEEKNATNEREITNLHPVRIE